MTRRQPTRLAAALAALALAAAGCDTGDGRALQDPVFPLPVTEPPETTFPAETIPPEPLPPADLLRLIAPWPNGAPIPTRHTCDGENVSPSLSWVGVPPDAIELAVTVTNLDDAGEVNWIVYAVDPRLTGLFEDDIGDAFEWRDSVGDERWNGPCPPAGEEHRYLFTVHALNQQLEAADDASATEVISILNLIAIAQGSVSGTYARAG